MTSSTARIRWCAGDLGEDGPMTPLRWGFLGAGNISWSALGPAVRAAAGAELVAVAARDLGRAEDFAAEFGAARAYDSYEDVLADPDIDAVYIGLANDAHEPWATAALASGRHVLCEKPLGLSAAEVDIMAAAADLSGRRLVEASWYHWHPRIRQAQELIEAGAIGPVQHVSAGLSFPGVPAGNFRLQPGHGGGALYDVGCYALSAVLWAMAGDMPDEVAARSRHSDTGIDELTEAVLTWDDGRSAQVRVSMAEPFRQWLVITGDSGEIELPGRPYTEKAEASELLVSDGRDTRRMQIPPANAYQIMVEEVSSAVRGGPGWLLPLERSRATAVLIDACLTSAAAGGTAVRGR
jgi:predicted dehydrogenase